MIILTALWIIALAVVISFAIVGAFHIAKNIVG